MGEVVIIVFIFFYMFIIMLGLGFWSLKRKDSTHFWSGGDVDPNTITDVKKYNRANAIMWFSYASTFLLYIIFLLLGWQRIAAFIMIVGCIGGVGWMILVYTLICKKYRK